MLDRIKSSTHNFPEYDFAKELLLTVSSFTYCEHDKSESNVLLYDDDSEDKDGDADVKGFFGWIHIIIS